MIGPLRAALFALVVAVSLAGSGSALADGRPGSAAFHVGVIGDSPYGPDQFFEFPDLVADVNADPDVSLVLHLGDIKSGSTRCDDSYFAQIRGYFDDLEDPLVYTPGDNEWTDCHRANNGAYNPYERLEKIRELFFPQPWLSLGQHKQLLTPQGLSPALGEFVENSMWLRDRIAFATLHVVGSNNGLAPWTGSTAPNAEQVAEVGRRINSTLAWVDAAFVLARASGASGVVLAMQADTFFGSNEQLEGFAAILERIQTRAAAFRKPVLLLQGDTHVFTVDKPLAGAPNVTRIVVQGETASEWLELTLDPNSPGVFSWQRHQGV